MAVEPCETANYGRLFFAVRLARIERMRRAALVEEAAKQNQRPKLQDGGLPIGGKALQECAG